MSEKRTKNLKLKIKKKTISLWEGFLGFFKYKDHVNIQEHVENHVYVTRRKIKLIGALRLLKKDIVEDKNGIRYKVIRLNLLMQNGISREIEEENNNRIKMIAEKVWNKKKYFYVKERKNNLDANIQFYKVKNLNERRKRYKESRQERIREMEYYNSDKTISLIMLLENKEIDKALNIYREAYECEILHGKELLHVLRMLENDL